MWLYCKEKIIYKTQVGCTFLVLSMIASILTCNHLVGDSKSDLFMMKIHYKIYDLANIFGLTKITSIYI